MSLSESEAGIMAAAIAGLGSLGPRRKKELATVVALITRYDYDVSTLREFIIISPPKKEASDD